MKPTIPAPFQIERHTPHASLAAATAAEATRVQSARQGRSAMVRQWLSSRRVQVLLAITLLGLERIAAQAFGVDPLPGLGTETGMLLLWGIGHCDTLDGPLVTLAKKALEEKNVNLVLPWVRAEDDPEIRHAFDQAQLVRDLGPEARSLADRHFLETLVRVHRAGEGAPFTGLKPAGLDLGPAVPAADAALKDGSIDKVIKLISDAITEGVRHRFHEAYRRAGFAPDEVKAGREFVDAYVPYIHYVERLWEDATGAGHDHHSGHVQGPGHVH